MSESVSSPPLLEMAGIAKRYGGIRALRDGALTITRAGIVHGLIGENGSGKSTTLGVMSGQIRPDDGVMRLNGEAVSFSSTLDAIAHGIAMVSQETALAPALTVAENILLGHRAARGITGIDWPATRRKAADILAQLDLDIDPEEIAGDLSPDQQQMVEIARALSMDARVLILDEPTSSLTDDQVAVLFKTIRTLTGHGVSVVFVSHRLAEMFEIVDELTVLRDGATAAHGPMSEFDVERVVDEMVGRKGAWAEFGAPERRTHVPKDTAPHLTVSGLDVDGVVHGVGLTVAPGEIVGLAGLVGSGRSELLEAIFGAREISGGTMVLGDEPYSPANPREAVRRGVGYLPPDRKKRGLVLGRSIRDNLIMSVTAFGPRLRLFTASQTDSIVEKVMNGMRVRAESPEVAVGTLSGGNQQKVALGKWLAADSKMLLLDEPTRGVDVAAKAEIHGLLREAAGNNAAVLVSSSENEELIALCDRILVLFRGAVIASVSSEEASEQLLSRYTGGHVSE